MNARFGFGALATCLVLVAGSLAACGSDGGSHGFGDPDGGTADAGDPTGSFVTSDGGGDGEAPCKNLQCQQVACSGGAKTTLSGTVLSPSKADPIYNAILYIPNAALQPFTEGVTCDQCGTVTSGEPIVTALSAADGTFTLEDVPAGDDIPLVIQVGRWRREVVVPHVEACAETKLDAEQTRLPRNKSEGDIPLMAIATSPYDPTECILRKIGIDDAEFTVPSGNGRVHIYKGNGATLEGASPPLSNTLWATAKNLERYDIVAFPCQTSGYPDAAGRQNIVDYANAGGRVFVTDLSQDIIKQGAGKWPQTASWNGSQSYAPTMQATIDTTFPKGAALADWLVASGATPTKGSISLEDMYERLTQPTPPSQRWIYASGGTSATQTYSFNTPVGAEADAQCGRAVYSSFHIANGGGVSFPSECNDEPLTAQEKVLEFLLFDLAACIQKDDTAPVPPPPVK